MSDQGMQHVGPCTYEGAFKAVNDSTGHVSILMCKGHLESWLRYFPNQHAVRPRKLDPNWDYTCEATWPLPGAVP